jgi:hypothetical protein
MNRLLLTAVAFAMIAFSAPVDANQIDSRKLLTEAQIAALPPSAREEYLEALKAMDFIRYKDAADSLIRAARRAPEAVDLNILAAEVAGRWGEITYGEESVRYYEAGLEILERIQHQEMGGTNRGRVAEQLDIHREALATVSTRDEARMSTGFRLMQTVRRERLQRAVRDTDEGAETLLGRDRKAEEKGDADYEKRAGEIWPQFAAPSRYVPPRFNPNLQQFGGFGMYGGMGMDPMMMGGGYMADPAMMYGGDPMMMGGGNAMYGGGAAGGFGGGDPFAAGGDPFATGGDPFGGGGGYAGDPFGGGGAAGDPFGGGGGATNPFVDGSGRK